MVAVWGKGTGARALAAVLCGASCLDGPPPETTTTTTTSSGSSTSGGSSTGTTASSIETSTTLPDSSSTTSTTSSTSSAGPACDDGDKNGDETDLDCGGSCPPCSAGQSCEDNSDCVTAFCSAGTCATPECTSDNDCAALNGDCTKGKCDPNTDTCVAEPANEGGACENGDLCSQGDTCSGGTCSPGQIVDCSEFDGPCSVGQCDPGSGSCAIVDKDEGSPCDDGDGCTFNEACTQGTCQAPPGEGAVFYADFSTAAGWTAQAPWEIGPAKPSMSGVGGADPGTDHSASDDNGVAGTAIGGLDTTPVHGPLCLTSPAFDTTGIGGSMWLSFWRHLHQPNNTTVIHKIEVWNGGAWKLVETGYGAVVNDAAWSFQKYNVSGNAAKDFKVRICVERKAGSPDFAGWSVDDLVIAPSACTP